MKLSSKIANVWDNTIRGWGTSFEDRNIVFPIDQFVEREGQTVFRAITINQSPEKIWPWLGQLRLSPYSYDWLDNGFHKSPRQLDPDLPPISVGDPFMVWPHVVDVKPFQSITFLCRSISDLSVRYGGKNWFANCAQKPGYLLFNLDWIGGTYLLQPVSPIQTRLIVKLQWDCRKNLLYLPSTRILELADFIMMRKQLLNLKYYSENQLPQ